MILSSGAKYNQINFSKNHVSGNARKIGVTVIWWFTDWEDFTEAIPAFVTLLIMPLSYSISDGIMLGIIMYVLMKVGTGMKGSKRPNLGPGLIWLR